MSGLLSEGSAPYAVTVFAAMLLGTFFGSSLRWRRFYEADGQSLKNKVEVVSVPFQELKRGCGHVDQRS